MMATCLAQVNNIYYLLDKYLFINSVTVFLIPVDGKYCLIISPTIPAGRYAFSFAKASTDALIASLYLALFPFCHIFSSSP